MLNPMADSRPEQSIIYENAPTSSKKAVVVGLYGIPGSGKTFLLEQLKQEMGKEHYAFYEGSKRIASIIPGGLDAFQKLEEHEKIHWRQLAIDTIEKKSISTGQVAVVTGHFMFWPEEEEAGTLIYTQRDLETFTHILYLDVPVEIVDQRRLDDTKRHRPALSRTHMLKWQQAEKTQLRRICRDHGILFSLVSPRPTLLDKVLPLLRDFEHHSEEYNLSLARSRLDEVLNIRQGQAETVLVMDADRTLAPMDSGSMFWEKLFSSQGWVNDEFPLKDVFGSGSGYSYMAFRQAALLYEEAADKGEFDALCQEVASAVKMYPEFLSLLQETAKQEHVEAMVVTCGLSHVWELVLKREGLSDSVHVIGGGRIADGYVVNGMVKAALVGRLQDTHHCYVWAFGDSPLDLEMLCKADQAVVVVGDVQTRSKTMDAALVNAIEKDGLRACQVVFPSNATPRLDRIRLPLVQITDHDFINSIFTRRVKHAGIQVLDLTKSNTSKVLMTPMRDAKVAGPTLRRAHNQLGWYLANHFLPDVIGIEQHTILHVQGHSTVGYRLANEHRTTIVALMRGGEAMALGVNKAFPLAMFVHAHCAEDITLKHVQGQHTVLLVDSVINSGKTLVQFVRHIRNLNAIIRIVVIAGVAQVQSVSGPYLSQTFPYENNLVIITLRLSENKFTGKGTTDTGNRLYNTTHLM